MRQNWVRSNGEMPSSYEYGLEPPDLPHYYDGFNATFSILCALDYKRDGLVRRVTTSSVAGLRSCPENLSPPLM